MNQPEVAGKGSSRGTLVGAIGLTTAITGGGYLLTLFQQALYSRTLGVNADTDALAAALAWVVGSSGLIGTTLMSVFLPVYVRAIETSDDHGQSLRRRATILALGAGAGLTALTVAAAPMLARALAPASEGAALERLIQLLMVAAPLQVTWLLVWLALATANARERYALAAASFLAPPVPLIAAFLLGVAAPEVVLLAYLAGTTLQLVVLWLAEPFTRPSLVGHPVKVDGAIGRDLVPVAAAFGFLALVPLEVRGLASFAGTGGVATADYASRLALAGQQVLLSGVLAVTFTRWSGRTAGPATGRRIDSIDRTLMVVALGGLGVAVALPFVSTLLVQLVLAGGRFSGADAAGVGSFLAWTAPGIGGHMLLMAALRALLADRRFRPLLAAGAAAAVVTPVVGLAAEPFLGLNGAALGYSVGYLASGLIAFVAARRRPAGDVRPEGVRPRDVRARVGAPARLAGEKRS